MSIATPLLILPATSRSCLLDSLCHEETNHMPNPHRKFRFDKSKMDHLKDLAIVLHKLRGRLCKLADLQLAVSKTCISATPEDAICYILN
ncbi:hypothetical protein GGS26DRAFT_185529 [Hypomontagnella submonticulosa]|nr:hypothetical protein GGS26DRAFT_185529 [Hypomontagnella submonticulosa]